MIFFACIIVPSENIVTTDLGQAIKHQSDELKLSYFSRYPEELKLSYFSRVPKYLDYVSRIEGAIDTLISNFSLCVSYFKKTHFSDLLTVISFFVAVN